MIGSIFISSLRHNDNGVQNLSGLNDYLLSIFSPLYYNGTVPIYPALYGDAIFTPLATPLSVRINDPMMNKLLSMSGSVVCEKISSTSSAKSSIYSKFYESHGDIHYFSMQNTYASYSSHVSLYPIVIHASTKVVTCDSI